MSWRVSIGMSLIIVSGFAWAWGTVEAKKVGEMRLPKKLDTFMAAFAIFTMYVLPVLGALLMLPY